MISRAANLFDQLDRGRRRFVSTVGALNPDQRSFRPQPSAWSALEVGHHVVLVERRSIDAMLSNRGRPSRRQDLRGRIRYALLWLVLRTGLRVKNPVPAATPRRDFTFTELESFWSATRGDLGSFLEELDERGLHCAAFRHPVGGYFDVERALRFLVAHLEHHQRQLDRLREHPDFPPG